MDSNNENNDIDAIDNNSNIEYSRDYITDTELEEGLFVAANIYKLFD